MRFTIRRTAQRRKKEFFQGADVEMEISQIMLTVLLLYSFFFGAAVGVFYDGCRMLRVLAGKRYAKRGYKRLDSLKYPAVKVNLFKPKENGVLQSVLTFLGDMICVLFCTCGIIVLNYSYNSGRFRFFTLLGVVIGFFVYKYTVGRLIMLIAEPIVLLVRFVVVSIFIILCVPFYKFGYILCNFVKKIISLYSFTLEKKEKKLYNICGEVFVDENDLKPSASASKANSRIRKKEKCE